MALWFVSYATSPITVTIYDVSIVIVYDVTLLLSITYHFQSRLGKTDCTDIWVIKLKNQVSPSIGFRVPHYVLCLTEIMFYPKFFHCINLIFYLTSEASKIFTIIIQNIHIKNNNTNILNKKNRQGTKSNNFKVQKMLTMKILFIMNVIQLV